MTFSRREFFKRSFISALSVPALALLMKPRHAWAVPNSPVSPSDPTASALGYVHDASKSEERAARPNGSTQTCSNCILFQGEPQKLEGQEGMWGVCSVIQGGMVNAQGWCKSWALKPGA